MVNRESGAKMLAAIAIVNAGADKHTPKIEDLPALLRSACTANRA